MKSKVNIKDKREIKNMTEQNDFYWYECSGNHRYRSWFMEGVIEVWCPEGHKMRKENQTSNYKVFNDIIACYEDL